MKKQILIQSLFLGLLSFSTSSFSQSNLNLPDAAGVQAFGDYYGNRVQLIPASQWIAEHQFGSNAEASRQMYQQGEFGAGPGQSAPLDSWKPDPTPGYGDSYSGIETK